MKTMIERWRGRVQSMAPANVGDAPKSAMAVAFRHCADELEDACTPRAPKPEWFGAGPGQWDSWWVKFDSGATRVLHGCTMHSVSYLLRSSANYLHDFDDIVSCIPVAREGFPRPVGWDVVKGAK